MPTLATMFINLFYSQCSFCSSKHRLLFLKHRKIVKAKKQDFLKLDWLLKIYDLALQFTAALDYFGIITILLFLNFFDIDEARLFVVCFLNEWKWALCFYKKYSYKK